MSLKNLKFRVINKFDKKKKLQFTGKHPPIDASLICHSSYWDEKIMFMVSSNKTGIGSKYSNRFIEILKDKLNNFCD